MAVSSRAVLRCACVTAVLATGFTLGRPAPVMAASSGLAKLGSEMHAIGGNLCKALDLKCKRKSRGTSRKSSTRSATKAAPPQTAPATAGTAPIPRAKPADLTPAAPAEATPIPRPDPRRSTSTLTPQDATPSAPPSQQGDAKAPSTRVVVAAPSPPEGPVAPAADCLAELKAVHAEYAMAAAPVSAGVCHVDGPVNLKSVSTRDGVVTFPEAPLLNCRFAAQLARWVSEQGAPLTAKAGKPLAKVWTGPGYQCRGRNGDASAKISEHGYGNAVDITTIATADGKEIQIADAGSILSGNYGTLKALRASACTYFTTVLGPGANSAHASHFHFDLGKHGRSDTYRICE